MIGQTSNIKVFLLGGTSEAAALAERLAADDRISSMLSLAGRTANPAASTIPVRVGGFGGSDGLANYIMEEKVNVVIDATHPFAAQISANAIAACSAADCPLIALERPEWRSQPGDDWRLCASVAAAITALPTEPRRVFSGLGRLSLDELERAPQHHFVIRLIDPPKYPVQLPRVTTILGRGPFRTDDDIALFKRHRIEVVLAKNAGGAAAVAKIEAARALGLTVMMIERPIIPSRPIVESVEDAWQALMPHVASPAKRGV